MSGEVTDVRPEGGEEEEYPPTPWHFKLLLISLVLYLAYRLVQLTVWLWGKVF